MTREESKSTTVSLAIKRWQLAYWPDLTQLIISNYFPTRILNLLEITAVSAVYFWVNWSVKTTMATRGLSLIPASIILVTIFYVAYLSPVLIHRDPLAKRGLGPGSGLFFRWDNLPAALKSFGGWTLFGAVCLLLVGFFLKPGPLFDFDAYTFVLRFGLYCFSAFMQDGLFFSYFLWRWQAVCGEPLSSQAFGRGEKTFLPPETATAGGAAILANAVLFSLYHLPNTQVMTLTLLMGMIWGRLFSRIPNLVVAAMCHALLGTILHLCLKISTKVGSTYHLGHKGFYRIVFSFLDPWVNGRFQW